jgi:integrase
MKINWSVKFFLYKRRNHQEKGVAIRMRFTLRGEPPVDIATGFIIDVDQWDAEKQLAKDAAPNADEINRTVNQWRVVISEVMSRYELIEKRVPARGEVRDLFNDLVGRQTEVKKAIGDNQGIELFAAFDLFTETMGKKNQWTDSTFEKFSALKRHLQLFDPLLSFHTLSESKLQEYVDHLTKNEMRNTTIAKNLSFLRWFLRWSYLSGYYAGHLHETFKPKLKGTNPDAKEIIYLTQEEVRKLQEFQFNKSQSALERVRDVFLFCCFTGLRYSDAAKLKRSDIKAEHIEVVTKKTVDALRIDLNDHSRAILEKYANTPFPNDLALPIISNEKMNVHLKDLGKLCGIEDMTRIVYFQGNQRFEEVLPKWQLLTTHVARRTFVVTALQLGIPAEVIMRWTGHSRYEAMKPYIAIVDELKRNSMSRFNSI